MKIESGLTLKKLKNISFLKRLPKDKCNTNLSLEESLQDNNQNKNFILLKHSKYS